MRKFTLTLIFALCCFTAAHAQLQFSGSDRKVIEEKPEASTGLDRIYVFYSTDGVKASYKASAANVRWLRFSNLGGGYAEEVAATADGLTYSITLGAEDMGYIIEDGTDRHYYWVVNYANHRADITAVDFAEEQECDRARLQIRGDASAITYYTINGAGRQLSRDILVDYQTLAYDAGNECYNTVEASRTLAAIDGTVGVPAPLCDTYFRVTADRFLTAWGMPVQVESGLYRAIAVQAETSATQTLRENENEQKVEGGTLGGSAPVEVRFNAVVTDAAIFREWQISRDQEFETVDDRFPQLEFTYTFRDNGTMYVRFIANNAAGTCEYAGETYDVFIGESALLCPNVFSPNGDGVNDEWRVSYKSLIDFECSIFNRWGQLMTSFTDPGQGWDGRHGGKLVPTGVYYYVIKAVGSDGRKYNLSGDINIVRKKANTTTSPSEEE